MFVTLHRFHANGFDPVDEIIQGLACCGYELRAGARILDFGCGTGDLVYRLRDRGFDACGFDIHDVVNYRSEQDRNLFRFSFGAGRSTADMTFDPAAFSVPFEPDRFDLVFSTQTLEHVMDMDAVMREIAKVLAPRGVSLHVYPRREALIEPHFFVPFGGRIQSWWWFYLWGLLGVRNPHQQYMPARQTADANYAYCQTGVHYRADADMLEAVRKYFASAELVDHHYYVTANRAFRRRAIWSVLKKPDRIANLAPYGKLRVLLTVSNKP